MERIEIQREIDPHEILVRSLKRPYHFKKNVLTVASLTPPPGKRDVSLLRLSYTNPDFCKQHSINILKKGGQVEEFYAGLFLFSSKRLEEACAEATDVNPEEEGLPKAKVVGSPMDDAKPFPNYIPSDITVYADDLGLPMHADLIYNLPPPERAKPSLPILILAQALLDKGVPKFEEDPNTKGWSGEPLELN
jgi:hypothetical protein